MVELAGDVMVDLSQKCVHPRVGKFLSLVPMEDFGYTGIVPVDMSDVSVSRSSIRLTSCATTRPGRSGARRVGHLHLASNASTRHAHSARQMRAGDGSVMTDRCGRKGC